MAWGLTTLQPLREGGPRAPPPAWLARPLLLCKGMRSWHDRAAPGVGATPPAARMDASDAVGSGPPPSAPLA